jgi:uncharacterized protein (DUF1810 family)
MSTGAFELERFLTAQAPVYAQVCAELRRGRKTSHWMWFIFPQLAGLGQSEMARYYGITSLAEARAYREHAVLGPRLCECTELVRQSPARSLLDLFGTPDDLKFRSCMTLFQEVARPGDPFAAALAQHCGGSPCPRTLALLGQPAQG